MVRRRIRRLFNAGLVAYVCVALGCVYWAVVRAPQILARDDNPRLVEAELRIARGPILDRQDRALARSEPTNGRYQRVYDAAATGSAVGYYNLRYGQSGVEAAFDAVLRGEPESSWERQWRSWLQVPQVGRAVRLTIDGAWQTAATTAMTGHEGAALLLSLPDGAIRALASYPTYDPNRLDDTFETLVEDPDAPLLNRPTQGQYQPGLALQPFIVASAVDRGWIALSDPVDVETPRAIDDLQLACREPVADDVTWTDTLVAGCPAPLTTLATRFGGSGLRDLWRAWGFDSAPSLPIVTNAQPLPPIGDIRRAALGQENLTVTPLQVAVAWAALAAEQPLAAPQLVAALQDAGGAWQSVSPSSGVGSPVVSSTASRALRAALTTDARRIEHQALVLSGPGGRTDSWYVGMAPAVQPRFLVVIVLEREADVAVAAAVGRAVLDAAMSTE